MFNKPTDGVLSNGFRTSSAPYHNGIDLVNHGVVPVVASAAGIVSRSYTSSSYGEVVFIVHQISGQTWETVYAHMKSGTRVVKPGEQVTQGQVLGLMGSTGDATTQHLHFELHKGRWNFEKSNAVNPLNYVNLSPALPAAETTSYATVKVESLNLRSGPSFTASVIRVLRKGEKLIFYGYANEFWAKLGNGYASNKDGKYLEISETPGSIGMATVKVMNLNLRTGPGLQYPVVHVLGQGESYPVQEITDGWYNLGIGWASNKGYQYMTYTAY